MTPAVSCPERRRLLVAGGGLIVCASLLSAVRAQDDEVLDIEMAGTPNGAHVWFKPRGLLVRPGQTVRWINRDKGNVHTVTAYHPDNGMPARIPAEARAWDSGYLMPGKDFSLVLDQPGVYDYYCIPHEKAGMAGRLVVGQPPSGQPYAASDAKLAPAALENLPDAMEIMAQGRVD